MKVISRHLAVMAFISAVACARAADSPLPAPTPELSGIAKVLVSNLTEQQREVFLLQYAQAAPEARDRLVRAWVNNEIPIPMGKPPVKSNPNTAIDLAAYQPLAIEAEKEWTPTTAPLQRNPTALQVFLMKPEVNLDYLNEMGGDCRVSGMTTSSISGGKVTTRRVGQWAITHGNKPVYTGCWNKNSIPIGPHLRYDDLGQLQLITVYGGSTASEVLLGATKKVSVCEEIHVKPGTNTFLRRAVFKDGAEEMIRYDDDGTISASEKTWKLPDNRQVRDQLSYANGILYNHCRFVDGAIKDPGSFWKRFDKRNGYLSSFSVSFNGKSFSIPAADDTVPSGAKQVITWRKDGDFEIGVAEACYVVPGSGMKQGPYRSWTEDGKEMDTGSFDKGERSGRWTEIEYGVKDKVSFELSTSSGGYVAGKRQGAWKVVLSRDNPESIALEKARAKKETRPDVLVMPVTHTIARIYKDGVVVAEERGTTE